jgi:cytochrome c oxidase subunit I
MSVAGGLIVLISGILFIVVLVRGHFAPRSEPGEYRFSLAMHAPLTLPLALNSFALWIGLMIGLTLTNYGYPILHLIGVSDAAVPAVYIGGGG